MRINLAGFLNQAADALRNPGEQGQYYAHGLDELLGHLRELKERASKEDPAEVLAGFFALYALDES